MEPNQDRLIAAEKLSANIDKRVEVYEERRLKSRKHLYLASMVTIGIAATGAVPQKIEALGVTFSSVQQRSAMYLLVIVVAYFLAEFGYLSSRKELMYKSGRGGFDVMFEEYVRQFPEEDERFNWLIYLHRRTTGPAYVVYEYLLPAVAACAAILLGTGVVKLG